MAETASGLQKETRSACGFGEEALVQNAVTINRKAVDLSRRIGEHKFSMPVSFEKYLPSEKVLALIGNGELATTHPWLPPRTRLRFRIYGTLQQILFGPTSNSG